MQKALEQLKIHEGFRALPYRCTSGYLTIGYGFNLDSGISTEEAELLLNLRVRKIYTECVDKYSWFDSLNEARKAVIINMIYNLGFSGFDRFRKTIKAIEAKDWELASKEMLNSKWSQQVKSRSYQLSIQMREGFF